MHTKRTITSENEAYRFASALLIHDDDFEAAMPTRSVLRDFVHLKSTWGISVAALVYRAHQLGYLDDRSYRSIQIQMSKWRKTEPASFPLASGRLLPKLVELRGGVTRLLETARPEPPSLAGSDHMASVADRVSRRRSGGGSEQSDSCREYRQRGPG